MSELADLYKVLGLPEDADAEAIKKAFRRLAKQHHPDANPNDKKAEEKFKQANQAYEILSDPEKRRRYDAMRRSPFGAGAGGAGASGGWPGGASWEGSGPFGGSVEDLFSMFFGQGGSPFGGGFRQEQAPADLDSEVWVSFEDAALGRPVTVQVEGQPQPLRLNLPPGAESGLRLRLAGQGGSRRRGRRGDLYLNLRVRPSERFSRQGLDISSRVEVNLAQALLGASISVPTLRSQLRVKLPPGTQPGTRLRLAGQGIHAEGRQGDHYAEIALSLPSDLDAAETEALRAMARRRGWEL